MRGQHFKGLLVLFSRSVMSDSLQPHGRQHARLPCLSPSPGVCSAHVHWVSDAIQPSHPLPPPSPPALNLSQHQGHFQSETEIVLICLLLFHFYQKKKKKKKGVERGGKEEEKKEKIKISMRVSGNWGPGLRNREVIGSGEDCGKQVLTQIYRRLFQLIAFKYNCRATVSKASLFKVKQIIRIFFRWTLLIFKCWLI